MPEKVFHRYDGFPAANSSKTVPRVSEADAKKLAQGCQLVEERGTTYGNYTIREYMTDDGKRVYIGGDFTSW
jgi:hypothetical protein